MTVEEREKIFSKEVLNVTDIAKLFDCSERTAYDIIANIKLRYNRLADKSIRTGFKGKVHVQDYLDCYGLDSRSQRYCGGELGAETPDIPNGDRHRRYFYPSVCAPKCE